MTFVKGRSGNPAGRPKELKLIRDYILDKTKSGQELADFMYNVAFDLSPPNKKDKRERWKTSDRLVAIKWLSDYGLGKPIDNIDIEGELKHSLIDAIAGARKRESVLVESPN